MKQFIIAAVALSFAVACKKKKEDSTPTATKDDVRLKIEHNWEGSANFGLNTNLVHPVTGDTLNFSMFKYYISNIKLKKADGTWWEQPESYHLVDLSAGVVSDITLADVPTGEYTAIEYTLGVDSLHNVSGSQGGDLAVSKDMFWNWNTGYIMVRMEGTAPKANMGSFAYHLGGYAGEYNIVTKKTHNFGETLSVKGTGACQIHLAADPQKSWTTVGSVSGNSMIHMPGAAAKTMAKDFYASFEFEHIHE